MLGESLIIGIASLVALVLIVIVAPRRAAWMDRNARH